MTPKQRAEKALQYMPIVPAAREAVVDIVAVEIRNAVRAERKRIADLLRNVTGRGFTRRDAMSFAAIASIIEEEEEDDNEDSYAAEVEREANDYDRERMA